MATRRTVQVLCFCASLFAANHAAAQYSQTNLGTFPGGPTPRALALNERGQVVGHASFSINIPLCQNGYTPYRAFSWTARGGMIDLGTLGGCQSHARVVNNLGQVAGDSLLAGDVEWHAFVWTPEDGMIDIGTLGSFGNPHGVYVADINDRGEVVGASVHAIDGQWHAFVWTKKTGMIDLGTLGTPNTSSQAIAVNERGQISGYVQGPNEDGAVLWEPITLKK